MAESNDSERYRLARERLNTMLERGVINNEFANEVLAQVRLFDEEYPTPQDLPENVTILVMSGRIIQAPSFDDALAIARDEGLEVRPYFCKKTLRSISKGKSRLGTPNLPILPTLGDLADQMQRIEIQKRALGHTDLSSLSE